MAGHRSEGRSRRRSGGFTLVELMVTLVITGIVAAIAVPSMRQFIARKRVEGAASELLTDLRFLRSVPSQQGSAVQVTFGSNDDATCYTLSTVVAGTSDCDCTRTGTPVCAPVFGVLARELKTVVVPRSSGIVLTASAASLRILNNGMPGGGRLLTVAVQSSVGGEMRVETNAVVRPTMCSVSGHNHTFPACP